ncbi:MAG: peptidase domain-containing ABC transporter, partial [Chryseotalea sp.]
MGKFPFYKQLDIMDCGPTCLRMIAKYYGKSYTLQELRRKTSITREGVSLLDLSRAAESIGFRTLGARITLNQLINGVNLPCIIHWNQNHFAVVYKVSAKKILVADPMGGIISYKLEEFVKGWKNEERHGIVLILEPNPDFVETLNDDLSQKNSDFKRLYSYIKPYRWYVFQLIIGLFIGSLIQLTLPFLTQSIVDVGINTKNIDFIYLILIGQVTLFFGKTSIDLIRRWIILQLGSRINIALISDFLIKILKLPLSFFGTKMIGDILQRIDDHARIERFINSSSLNIVFSFFNLFVFGIVLLIYSSKIFLTFILFSAGYLFYVFLFLKKRAELDFKRFQYLSDNQSTLIQLINGVSEIKINNAATRKLWDWEQTQIKIYKLSNQSMKLQQYQDAGSMFLNEIKNIVITIMTALAVIKGDMSLGMMLSVQYIIGQLNSPINEFILFTREWQDARLSFSRVNEIHLLENEENDKEVESNLSKDFFHNGSIEFRNVSFWYGGPSSHQVLKNLSFTIPIGKVTAIVGSSGSGKTTILKLLLKFYPANEGRILVNGQDLNQISSQVWRNQCGVVMQEGFLFSDTIAKNIGLSDDEIDSYKLLHASRIACIHDFIEALPLRYNTKLGSDGIGLSIGQKQRILIARSIYKDTRVLFFDEATSALDAKNEKNIVENLQ